MKWWKNGSTTVTGVYTAGENFFKNVVLILKTQVCGIYATSVGRMNIALGRVYTVVSEMRISDTRFVFMIGFRVDVRFALDLYMFVCYTYTHCIV